LGNLKQVFEGQHNELIFDDLVIGSSPLMLLQAGFLARENRRVCLVECEKRLGGAWQTAVLKNGEQVEIACHLIEFFPGIYQLLEEAAGVPFVQLDAQPIRILRSGRIFPYFSRSLMLASGVRLILGWIKAQLEWSLGRAKDRNRLLNFKSKLLGYFRLQLSVFFNSPIMKGPQFGFVNLMDRLVERNLRAGVKFFCVNVNTMSFETDGYWHLTGVGGETLRSEHVHCTTSTNLRLINKSFIEAAPQDFTKRFCVVVDIPNTEIQTSQSYVAFWKDPPVTRISRIDMPKYQKYKRFLVEFNVSFRGNPNDLAKTLHAYFAKARIIESNGSLNVVGEVNCKFTTNVDQLPVGEIATNFWTYYSLGNLAAGLAAWRKMNCLPRLKRTVS
jgi:hypothetical protein